MVCKTTSTNRRRRAGMSLVELLVATAIASVLATAVASLLFYTGRTFAAMANYVDLDNQSRRALDTISQQIRQANRVVDITPSSLTLEDADGSVIKYAYDESAKTLTRTVPDQPDPTILLEECFFLEFTPYQRNPVNGAYDQYPAGTAATCKLVQIHWICSRTTLGTIINTESVQSAKVVIRKQ